MLNPTSMNPLVRHAAACFLVLVMMLLMATADSIAGVSLPNGCFTIGYTDVAFPGDIRLNVQRTYNSKSPEDGMFGPGWGTFPETVVRVEQGTPSIFEWLGGQISTPSAPSLLATHSGWIRKLPSERVDRFDQLGRLVHSDYLDGQHLEVRYSAENFRPTSLRDNLGNEITFAYDRFDHVVEARSSYGSAFYEYDWRGFLIYSKDIDGNQFWYSYDDRFNLTRISYSDGSHLEIEYFGRDFQENVRKIIHRDGTIEEFSYENSSGLLQVRVRRESTAQAEISDELHVFPDSSPVIKRPEFEEKSRLVPSSVRMNDAKAQNFQSEWRSWRTVWQVPLWLGCLVSAAALLRRFRKTRGKNPN